MKPEDQRVILDLVTYPGSAPRGQRTQRADDPLVRTMPVGGAQGDQRFEAGRGQAEPVSDDQGHLHLITVPFGHGPPEQFQPQGPSVISTEMPQHFLRSQPGFRPRSPASGGLGA